MNIFEDLDKIISETPNNNPENKVEETTPPDTQVANEVDGPKGEDVKYDTFNVYFAELPESFKKEVMEALQSKLNFPTTDKRALDIINSKLSSIAFYTGTIEDFINKYQIKL